MRDVLVSLAVIAGCFYTLKKPYAGVLLWSWLSYMNPHRLCYGFAYDMPFAQVTALTLFGSMLVGSKQVRNIPLNTVTIIWFVFIIWMGITTLGAYFPNEAAEQFIKVVKIQLIIFLTIMLVTDMDKLRQLIWVIVLSIGYFSIKGGLFTLLTGGSHKVWGPPGSFVEDNNGLAVAVLMVIALMIYLYQTETSKTLKRFLMPSIVLSLFTVLGSQSRGALIAIATVGLFYWFKSRQKVGTAIVITILAIALISFMPSSWHERMNTIETYQQDGSAMGRLNSWQYAFHAANDNILGMGFESWMPSTFAIYAPDPSSVLAAHSIYFSVLADHGWIGLVLFLGFYFFVWRTLSKIIKQTSKSIDLLEYNVLAKMIQVGFIAYFSGGAFLSLSYFDLPWHLAAFVIILQRILAEREIPAPSTEQEPALVKSKILRLNSR